MTDNIEMSFSFQVGGASGLAGPVEDSGGGHDTFAYAECEQVAVNDQAVMIVNRRNRNKMLVSRQVADVLPLCSRLDTLPNHAARLCAAVPMLRGQEADVRQVLASAREAGILPAGDEFVARLGVARSPVPSTSSRVFIITCDRPAAVARLLDSLRDLDNAGSHEHLVLIDDSRDAGHARQNRDLVARFNAGSPKAMVYFGAGAAAELLSGLIQAFPARERALRFLLDRARWSAATHRAGAQFGPVAVRRLPRAVVLDDDIVPRGASARTASRAGAQPRGIAGGMVLCLQGRVAAGVAVG
ncbi:MAG: hypothetical protein R3E50_06215 [Halioglobus sp.]